MVGARPRKHAWGSSGIGAQRGTPPLSMARPANEVAHSSSAAHEVLDLAALCALPLQFGQHVGVLEFVEREAAEKDHANRVANRR